MLAFQLYQLQQVDSERDALEKRVAELEALLADRRALLSAEEGAQKAEAAYRVAQRALQEAEAKAQGLRDKLSRTENTLYGGSVTSPRELQALQAEVEMLKRHLEAAEDAQLEAMLALEEAEGVLNAAEEHLKAVKTERNTQEARWRGEIASLQEKIERLSKRRQVIAGAISAEALGLYEKLRSKRGGQAVALVSDNACDACGAPLPPPVLQAARSSESLAFCPTCGRILCIL